jgi:2-oxoglutarate dehydrogenase E1 component
VVIATPKSMLRNKQAVSEVSEFTAGSWKPAMGDPTITDHAAVERIVLCSGKIRWELVNARSEAGLDGKVAILPLERLYPLPARELAAEFERYRHVSDVRFVQDEPENQGAWPFINFELARRLKGRTISVVSRPASAATATGSSKRSAAEQTELLARAFTL